MTSGLDRLRHWLIRKFSGGDMIILNAHIKADGSIRPSNPGPSMIAHVEVDVTENLDGTPLYRFVLTNEPMTFYRVNFR